MLHSPENWGFNGADIMSVFERQQGMLKLLNQPNSVELGSNQYLGLVSSSFPVAPPADHGGTWSPPTLKEEGDMVLIEKNNSNKRKSESVAEEKSKEKRSKPAKSSPENSSNSTLNQKSKPSEVQKPDYIHVRARRGQATDSHSLAERARREKIGKKMKCLQELVPGCHKVTGKAGMLDEIINYVQSLQRQVEFLSMKLTAVNPSLEGKPDNFPANLANFPAMANLASLQQLLTQQGAINCMMDFPLLPSQVTPEGNAGSSVSIPSCISELQPFSTWNLDLQGVYSENNLGFQ